MGILRRLRERGEALMARRLRGAAPGANAGGFESSNGRRPATRSFTAEIPGSSGPLWQMRVEVQSEPRADGEHLRLRAQWRLSLRRHAARKTGTAPALPAKLGRWIERRLRSPLVQTLADPLLDRDISSWVELHASDAALDEGSHALVPERLSALGIEPVADQPVQSWAGALPGSRPGFAMLTLLQLDKAQLPAAMQKRLGAKPFQLAAAVASVVEEA